MSDPHTLTALKRRLARLARPELAESASTFPLGAAAVDDALAGGLARGALHEIYAAAHADAVAAAGFGLALAQRAANGRPIVWARQDVAEMESGALYAPGLAELGQDPAVVILIHARDAAGVLRAAMEALRCGAVGAVGMELWGKANALDLTASRRLAMAAAASGVTALEIRAAATPAPSAAMTRWAVASAPSRALAADAPGAPAFALSLLRHRGGVAARDFVVEWDRDQCSFRDGAPLSRALVSVSPDRPAAEAAPGGAGVVYPLRGSPPAARPDREGPKRAASSGR